MKYFDELTKAQQEQVLDKYIDGPLFNSVKDDLKVLFKSRCYVFDAKLKLHVLPSGGE